MLLKEEIIKNKSLLNIIILCALKWWNNDINLQQKIEFIKKWFPNKNLYFITDREIQEIFENESKIN